MNNELNEERAELIEEKNRITERLREVNAILKQVNIPDRIALTEERTRLTSELDEINADLAEVNRELKETFNNANRDTHFIVGLVSAHIAAGMANGLGLGDIAEITKLAMSQLDVIRATIKGE